MDNEKYEINTEAYKGPFHLLLTLIEERKLFINDISLSSITEEYLKYVNSNNINHSLISNFILVASTLILIKSKSLLPNLNLTDEEEKDIQNLEERLKLYKKYCDLSINIKNNFGKKIIYFALEKKNIDVVFLPDNQITKDSMMVIVGDVLNRIPKNVFMPEVEVKKVMSLEEMIAKLKERIESSISFHFKDFAGNVKSKEEKVNLIISFLAMLELVRGGILNVIQENNFEDILIEKSIVEEEANI